jgi:hypothetical protein
LFANEIAQQSFGSVFIASRLDQHIKNKAILIDRVPEPMLLAVDRNDNFVEMPFVTKLRRALADFVGEVAPEFPGPTPNRFITDNDAASGQKIFDHPQAEWKAEIQPNCVSDHFGGKAMAAIKGVGRLDHRRRLPENHGEFVNVTVPCQRIMSIRQACVDALKSSALNTERTQTSPATT